jgi:predicted pyridoxine 5'-phosphate oxidase superfamily flavin-nucleotide-binding protein
VSPLNDEMRQVVAEQRLGFVATVGADGSPNLSPKGTVSVWDDEHLVFLDIKSPGTVENLRAHPAVEINVVDPVVRRGYRFRGTARVLEGGAEFEQVLRRFGEEPAEIRTEGEARGRIRHVVLVHVEDARPLVSPAYDAMREDEIVARWEAHQLELAERRHRASM